MENKITFKELGLSKETLKAIEKKGFTHASEIQAKVIPKLLEKKQDIVGISHTGSGKTAAFALPIIDLIKEKNKSPAVLVLTPTRELALQVTEEIKTFKGKKKLNILTVYGGSSINNQIRELKKGVDIVVGTPGRILDLIERRSLDLSKVEHFILDEADEMLKMGFIDDIEIIFEKTSPSRQVLLFSATMPAKIQTLAKKYMKNQTIVKVKQKELSKKNIKQEFFILKREQKLDTLIRIIEAEDFFYGIIFAQTKADVDQITKNLKKAGFNADCIHGDIAQNKREKILQKFRDLKINVLVATDVAARGIDVENLTHVINHSVPKELENYVHRIGRTGRAGKKGIAISFLSPKQKYLIKELEKATNSHLTAGKLATDKEILDRKKIFIKKELGKLILENKNETYLELAQELLEEFDPQTIISALLTKLNSKTQEKKSSSKSKKRLFIARGKDDGFGKRELFNFLEKESKIKIDGENIKINGKFSFVNVPSEQAEHILNAFSRKKGRNIVELAQEK